MKMKKLVCAVLAVSMMLVSASAAYMSDGNHVTDDTAGNANVAGVEVAAGAANGDEIGEAEVPVYIQATTDHETTNVYAISYDVSELVFVYSGTESKIWNPETLKYEVSEDGSWDRTSQDITVTNYSDIAVKVTPSNTDPSDDNVTVTLGSALELASAYDGDMNAAGTAKSGKISVGIDGEPSTDYATKTLLTTVTLTVTDNR